MPPVKIKKGVVNKDAMPRVQRAPAMRLVGAEIEFQLNTSRATLTRQIDTITKRQGWDCINQEVNRAWTLKTDHCGWELTTPAFSASAENVQKVYQIMEDCRREIFFRHNVSSHPRDCGFHVHIDVRDLNTAQLRNLVNIFWTFEPALRNLQHRSRRTNGWAIGLVETLRNCGPEGPREQPGTDGYPLNFHYSGTSFGRYYGNRKTIEFRYGATTVRGRRVVNWIQILLFLVEASKHVENYMHNDCGELEDLYAFMQSIQTGTWLDARRHNLICWMKRRYQELYQRNRHRHNPPAENNT